MESRNCCSQWATCSKPISSFSIFEFFRAPGLVYDEREDTEGDTKCKDQPDDPTISPGDQFNRLPYMNWKVYGYRTCSKSEFSAAKKEFEALQTSCCFRNRTAHAICGCCFDNCWNLGCCCGSCNNSICNFVGCSDLSCCTNISTCGICSFFRN